MSVNNANLFLVLPLNLVGLALNLNNLRMNVSVNNLLFFFNIHVYFGRMSITGNFSLG